MLPTSTKSQNLVITLTPGLTGMSDVSGSYSVQLGGTFHGKSGTKVQVDGMSIQNMQSNGATGYQLNAGTVAEIAVQTSGISAESTADGIVVSASIGIAVADSEDDAAALLRKADLAMYQAKREVKP